MNVTFQLKLQLVYKLHSHRNLSTLTLDLTLYHNHLCFKVVFSYLLVYNLSVQHLCVCMVSFCLLSSPFVGLVLIIYFWVKGVS